MCAKHVEKAVGLALLCHHPILFMRRILCLYSAHLPYHTMTFNVIHPELLFPLDFFQSKMSASAIVFPHK